MRQQTTPWAPSECTSLPAHCAGTCSIDIIFKVHWNSEVHQPLHFLTILGKLGSGSQASSDFQSEKFGKLTVAVPHLCVQHY
jgi:hypothetical protein